MKEMSETQKNALDHLVEEVPGLLEVLGKAIRKGATIYNMKVELIVKQFDGSEVIATIDFDGDVEWKL